MAGHHYQVPARRHATGHHNQLPETHNKRRRGQRPGHLDYLHAMRRLTSGASGNGFCTTIKYLRGAADIALGTMIKFL
jgi:hypothetical protein